MWCQEQIRVRENFDDVIFTDESTIQLEHHGCAFGNIPNPEC